MEIPTNEDEMILLAIQLSKEEEERDRLARDLSRSESDEQPKSFTLKFDAQSYGQLLIGGFSELCNSTEFSDIALTIGNESIPAHKIVLCAWSDTIRTMLENGNWKESKDEVVSLPEKDPALFKKMLQYMYQGVVHIEKDELISLLALANYYGVASLKDSSANILIDLVDDETVLDLLEVAIRYDCTNLYTQCAKYLAEEFSKLYTAGKLNKVNIETWVEMMKSDDLQVASEEEAYKAAIDYCHQFPEYHQQIAAIEKLLPHIRFPMLPSNFLTEVVETEELLIDIPLMHDILYETYRYKAYPHNNSVKPQLTLIKPRQGTLMFDPSHCDPNITLSNDHRQATNRNRHNTWASARCFPAFDEGISYREFRLKFSSYMMIGVETANNVYKQNRYAGQGQFGWSWYSAGQIYHNNTCTQMSAVYSTGDTIGMLVDTTNGRLAFYRNGKRTIAGFFNLPKMPPSSDVTTPYQPLFPVLSLYGENDSATIVPGNTIPQKLPKGWDISE